VVMRETQRLYIKASAAANAYIEALEFDVAAGAGISPEKYAGAAESVRTNTADFLTYAQGVTQGVTEPQAGQGKSRGAFLLALPLLTGLVDLGMKLNDAAKAANQQQRELIVKALVEKKWQPFQQLSRE